MAERMKAAAILSLLAVGAVAALPDAAQAGPRADYKQTFSTAIPGASTGVDTQILYKHPDDPDAKPIPLRQEIFTYPKGTKFDSSAVPDCTASLLELQLLGEMACPPESRIGGGEEGTFMTGFPGAGETPMEIDAFDDGSAFMVLGSPKDFPLRLATRARREGRVITVDAPRQPGGPPEGESACAGSTTSSTLARSGSVPTFVRPPSVRQAASGRSNCVPPSRTAQSRTTSPECLARAADPLDRSLIGPQIDRDWSRRPR